MEDRMPGNQYNPNPLFYTEDRLISGLLFSVKKDSL